MKAFVFFAMLISAFSVSASTTPFNNFIGEFEVMDGKCSDSYYPNEILSLNSLSSVIISKTSNTNEVRIQLIAQNYSHDFTYAEFGTFNEKFLGDGVNNAGWMQETSSLGYLYKIMIQKNNSGYTFSYTNTFEAGVPKNTKCSFNLRKL